MMTGLVRNQAHTAAVGLAKEQSPRSVGDWALGENASLINEAYMQFR